MASPTNTALGSKTEAIANARRLLHNGDIRSAGEQAQEIIDNDPDSSEAHLLLGATLRRLGSIDEARKAETKAIELSSLHQDLFQAAMGIAENSPDSAERLLRPYLKDHPDDPVALRLLAEVAARTGNLDAAERLVKGALDAAPDYPRAIELRRRIEKMRSSPNAVWIAPSGPKQYAEALELYERIVTKFPGAPENWVAYGHVLRTIGAQDQAVAAYRRAIDIKPSFGAAWWSLADLKTMLLEEEDIHHLEELIKDGGAPEADRGNMHFALGRALEQAGRFKAAFYHYQQGNRLKAASSNHDRNAVSCHVDASIRHFTSDFFEQRQRAGFEAPDPIFILGMPRAGSTLIEQILSSHRQVEGTMELADLPAIANWLGDGKEAGFKNSPYLDKVAALPPAELRKLGQGYIWGTRLRRRTGKPLFTDKMPNNWLHVGMILTILPNARIIDARRHPLACGMSLFRQNFAKGQAFSYDLADIGSFYSEYVRMMGHFDNVMPGRIIRVIHEELVAEPEVQIRHLLDRLGLPFDQACLKFHENRRAVRTSSSEQVRRPINREGLDQWKSFERWLGPLKQALGPIVDSYPSPPKTH